ncbi:MAG: hypothetical protein KC442_18410, partial [Thermomicrobiales bacterium]|nr:hypothetical protein [Thermomicrobiales bacterium]
MTCRYCNSALAAGTTVCPQCGAPQPNVAPQAAPSPRRQVEFRVSWGAPADVTAPPVAAPIATHHTPPPPMAHVAAARAPWLQHQIWVPAPRLRSFRWQAFIALILYFPFFLPGLIANIIWW